LSIREQTCCFTGHRPAKLPWGFNENDSRCIELKTKIYDIAEAVYYSGIRHYICGMAMGCDLYFCETALRLRDEYGGITVEAAIPCQDQAEKWRGSLRVRYDTLVERCDTRTVLRPHYTPDCMRKRNEYMVSHSSVIIAVFDGSSGGTRQTIMMAKRAGIEIIQIAP
jgi:uncharacterized phage-like protein YoqJ